MIKVCGVTSRDGIKKNWSQASRQKAAASGDWKDFCSPHSFACNVWGWCPASSGGLERCGRDVLFSVVFLEGKCLHFDEHTRVTSWKPVCVRFHSFFLLVPSLVFSVHITGWTETVCGLQISRRLFAERDRRKKKVLDVSLFLPCCGSSSTNYFLAVDMHTDALFVLFEGKFCIDHKNSSGRNDLHESWRPSLRSGLSVKPVPCRNRKIVQVFVLCACIYMWI